MDARTAYYTLKFAIRLSRFDCWIAKQGCRSLQKWSVSSDRNFLRPRSRRDSISKSIMICGSSARKPDDAFSCFIGKSSVIHETLDFRIVKYCHIQRVVGDTSPLILSPVSWPLLNVFLHAVNGSCFQWSQPCPPAFSQAQNRRSRPKRFKLYILYMYLHELLRLSGRKGLRPNQRPIISRFYVLSFSLF